MPVAAQPPASKFLDQQQLAQKKLKEMYAALRQFEQGAESLVIDLADQIAPVYREIKQETSDITPEAANIFDIENLKEGIGLTIKYVRPLYKFLDVLDGIYGVNFPTYSLYRMLWIGGKLTSIGGILIALKNLGEISVEIARTVKKRSEKAVEQNQYNDFYLASFLLTAETVLFTSPISFRFAWKGTRLATNQLLFHIRRLPFGDKMLALVMSFVHWILRDIPRSAAHNVDNVISTVDFIFTELNQRRQELVNELDQIDIQPVSKCDVKNMTSDMTDEYLDADVELGSIPC